MKLVTLSLFLIFGVSVWGNLISSTSAELQGGRKPQDTYVLANEAKLGAVKFTHLNHTTKNRAVDGTQIACVQCHHTAQPAAEVVKHPPHKTAWPADRTSTLTADLLEKDPSAPLVDLCTDCHARAETKPKLLPELPQIKLENAGEPIVLNNQQAFHRGCAGCHDEIAKVRETLAPTSKKCIGCHKKTAT
jgi:hypothetical protein